MSFLSWNVTATGSAIAVVELNAHASVMVFDPLDW